MSRTPTQNAELSLRTQATDRDPLAEELFLLDLVQNWQPTKARPFLLTMDIDAAMAPHPGPTARSNCEKFGWLERAQDNKQVPKTARRVSEAGREVMRETAFAAKELGTRIAEAEARMAQFRQREEHTDLPRLKALRTWLVGEPEAAPAPVAPKATPTPKPQGKGAKIDKRKLGAKIPESEAAAS